MAELELKQARELIELKTKKQAELKQYNKEGPEIIEYKEQNKYLNRIPVYPFGGKAPPFAWLPWKQQPSALRFSHLEKVPWGYRD